MVNDRICRSRNSVMIYQPSEKNVCTEDQIAYLAQNIENACKDKKKTLTALVDFTKAFYIIWKKIFSLIY
jgi:hypothetical protein